MTIDTRYQAAKAIQDAIDHVQDSFILPTTITGADLFIKEHKENYQVLVHGGFTGMPLQYSVYCEFSIKLYEAVAEFYDKALRGNQ